MGNLKRNLAGIAALGAILVLSACGGGGGTADLAGEFNTANTSSADAAKGTAVLVTEYEIATLPAWQQEQLADPGWNQPYIEPRPATPVEPPTPEMLMEDYERVLADGIGYARHGSSGSKGLSYLGDGGYPEDVFVKGEYNLSPRDVTPPYGCNSNGENGIETHAFEDVILSGDSHLSWACTAVLEAHTTSNWFNSTGGRGNDALSAVYQIFSTMQDADPLMWNDPDYMAEFEELCYRSDLAPGVGPGGDCSAAEAFLLTDLFWKRFCSVTRCLPDLEETEWFNILIAPTGGRSDLLSSAGADARTQKFYFGTVDAGYDRSMIVGLENANSGCETFNDSVQDAYIAGNPYHHIPIYGVLLKRWQQAQLAGMAGPWESSLGWPVWGPVPNASGAQRMTSRGTYYVWGLWFERGFMWWVDYDQSAYPATPDEVQVYRWTGRNVFCLDQPGDGFEPFAPALYYGGSGELGVCVVVDSCRSSAEDDWQDLRLEASGTHYEVHIPAGTSPHGTGNAEVAMHAHAYGGVPNEDGSYGYYVWAFRDGVIQMGDELAAQYVYHSYGLASRDMQGVYTVRVQVTDADWNVAYGDSLPIVLIADGVDTGGRYLAVVRNDGGVYDANYDALAADLDELGVFWMPFDYSGDISTELTKLTNPVVIWYRGGPGNAAEQALGDDLRPWTADEIENYRALLSQGVNVLMVSQHSGYGLGEYFPTTYASAWEEWYGFTVLPGAQPASDRRHMEAHGLTGGLGIGGTGQHGYLASEPLGLRTVSAYGGKGPSDGYDNDGAQAAERYNDSNSSGDIPILLDFSANGLTGLQACGLGYYSGLMRFGATPCAADGFVPGLNLSPAVEGAYDLAFLSWGCIAAPYSDMGVFPDYNLQDSGPGRLWCIGYPWNATEVVASANGGMTRAMLLRNILCWLDYQDLP
ncbi:hypothetical protein JW859_05505 [bacterium]|nr:hypothetical protein [bacterium]